MDNDILQRLTALLQSKRDDQRAPKMKAYLKNHFDFIGVDSTNRKQVVSEIWKTLAKPPKEEIFSLVMTLWDQPYREYQYVAMDISQKYVNKLDPNDIPLIATLISSKSWWDTVDFLASNLLGGAIARDKNQIASLVKPFITSSDMWMRRSAILCQLKYKDEVNTDVLSDCILQTIEEKEFFIRKAHGWALRQYSKFNPKWVSSFIQTYQDKLSPLAIREASKYI